MMKRLATAATAATILLLQLLAPASAAPNAETLACAGTAETCTTPASAEDYYAAVAPEASDYVYALKDDAEDNPYNFTSGAFSVSKSDYASNPLGVSNGMTHIRVDTTIPKFQDTPHFHSASV